MIFLSCYIIISLSTESSTRFSDVTYILLFSYINFPLRASAMDHQNIVTILSYNGILDVWAVVAILTVTAVCWKTRVS